jgi:hypothetical protein
MSASQFVPRSNLSVLFLSPQTPYAEFYDAENYRTCLLDRGRAGHDPLRGLCNVGETCTISGPYKRQIRDTYILDFGDRRVHVEAPEGSPPRLEVPSGK